MLEELIEFEFFDQLDCQPGGAKLLAVFDANVCSIDGDPLWFWGVEELELHLAFVVLLLILTFRKTVDVNTSLLVELAKPGDNSLPWSSLGAIGLGERPLGVSLAVLVSKLLPNEHARMLGIAAGYASSKVVTTTQVGTEHENLGKLKNSGNQIWPRTPRKLSKKNLSTKTLGKLG
ncbi:hypothetical protein Pla52n_50760 [Stieleria varia]|uniref:Uncharacterized protein n=1 Tax=Stieleria varia TaxID=2528005 RepID=A0A5C6AGH7_9BACT|nr:hypothetical protein Pla52n_50760 [Stieleria varia]